MLLITWKIYSVQEAFYRLQAKKLWKFNTRLSCFIFISKVRPKVSLMDSKKQQLNKGDFFGYIKTAFYLHSLFSGATLQLTDCKQCMRFMFTYDNIWCLTSIVKDYTLCQTVHWSHKSNEPFEGLKIKVSYVI